MAGYDDLDRETLIRLLQRRDAERQAVKARKVWAVLTTPAQNAAIVRRPRAANAVALHEAA